MHSPIRFAVRGPWRASVAIGGIAVVVGLLVGAFGPLDAQPHGADGWDDGRNGVPAEPGAALARAARVDLAAAYLRLERQFFARLDSLDSADVAEINRQFDRATVAFFMQLHRQAVKQIDAITLGMREDPPTPSTADRLAMAVKLAPTPSVAVAQPGVPAVPVLVRVQSMYEVEVPPPAPPEADGGADGPGEANVPGKAENEAGPRALELVVRLRDPHGREVSQSTLRVKRAPKLVLDEMVILAVPASLAVGTYRLEIGTETGKTVEGPIWPVVAEAPSDFRHRIGNLLDRADAEHPALAEAVVNVRARLRLIGDAISPEMPAQTFLDWPAHMTAVAAEAEALMAGRDPFVDRRGDTWRVLPTPRGDIPMRIVVPDGGFPDEGWPVVIALHGMGGDENMFVDAYGAGRLKALAARRRFILVSPATQAFGRSADNLDRLLAGLAAHYPLDASRVYLIGHSMGAGVVGALSMQRPHAIAAACCIAGGTQFGRHAESRPMLVVAGALDPIASADRLRQAAARASQANAPVEFRQRPHEGHTLVVGAAISEVLDWLFTHRHPTAGRAAESGE